MMEPPGACCSQAARAADAERIGTAGFYERYIVVECRPPWTPKVFGSVYLDARVSALLAEATKTRDDIRFLVVKPDPEYSVADHTRVMVYDRPRVAAAAYLHRELSVPNGELAAVIEWLLYPDAPAAADGERSGGYATFALSTAGLRDLFVCNHGSRDACCGRFGGELAAELRARLAATPVPGLRVWRCSHLGGHRFAPNVLELPTGRSFGHADATMVERLIRRAGDVGTLVEGYRGWTLLPEPAQFVERELFRRYGWEWLARLVACEVEEEPGGGDPRWRVRLSARREGCGEAEVFEALVARDASRTVLTPAKCGGEPTTFPCHVVHELRSPSRESG